MKVTIVGAGNVGATAADVIASRSIASDVTLLDIKEGFAEGKALDIMQTATTRGFNTRVVGSTSDYSKTSNSDVVVITSGIPRKPGMTREELIGINAKIVKDVTKSILEYSNNPIFIVVSILIKIDFREKRNGFSTLLSVLCFLDVFGRVGIARSK